MSLLLSLPILSILDPFIKIMGIIINYIYKFMLLFGIEKVAVCIIVFTVVIKLLMLPLTYKQQKFSKVSAKMNPEIQAISEKYKGKKDQESMMKMQMEQQAVYKKYGSSPMSGCLPMLIIMLLLFALYPVVYSIPSYVDDVNAHYSKLVDPLKEKGNALDGEISVLIKDGEIVETAADGEELTAGEGEELKTFNFSDAVYAFYKRNGVYVRNEKKFKYTLGESDYKNDEIIAIMAGFSEKNWNDFFNGTKYDSSEKINGGSIYAWNAYADTIKDVLSQSYTSGSETIVPKTVKEKIVDINTFVGVNIFDRPSFKSLTLIIPLLSALLQLLQSQLTMALNKTGDDKKKKKSTEPNPMDSMKTMNYVMPIFSGIICFNLPIGVGIYWITSSLVSIILQLIINVKLKDMDVNVFVEESEVKNKKQLEKYGVHNENDGKMAAVAKTSTKSIASKAAYNNKNGKNNKFQSTKNLKIPEEKRHLSAGSIAAIANIYKNDEEDDADKSENND